MELTNEAVDQLRAEIEQAIDNQAGRALPHGLPIGTICENKDLILGFLDILTGLLPGVIGKIAGKAIRVAADAWFAKQCPR